MAEGIERWAEDDKGNRFCFTVDALGSAYITDCEAETSVLCVPRELCGATVFALETGAFSKLYKVREIVCPPTLRHIASRAFCDNMNLERVVLDEGIVSLGDEAFSLCPMLEDVCVPRTLSDVGARIFGDRGGHWMLKCATLIVPDGHPFLYRDDKGVLYQRQEAGWKLVDASQLSSSCYVVESGCVEIGEAAFVQLADLKEVVLPDGVRVIGRDAFRGCTSLHAVEIPESLETICDAAFSCTAIESIYLPKNCVHLGRRALVTGPVVPNMQIGAYASSLCEIRVHPDNPRYCMRGCVLCKRMERTGELVAVLCPNRAENVELGPDVALIGDTAFAGTSSIGTLHVSEGVSLGGSCGILPHCACCNLKVDLAQPFDGMSQISLEIPQGPVGRDMLATPPSSGRVDVEELLAAYDLGVMNVDDGLARARQMVARLARPVHLSTRARTVFTRVIEDAIESVCIHFGARNYWAGYDQMADAGILDESTITHMVGVLSGFGDGSAASYLLNLKRARFGKAVFDYAL